MPRGRKVAFVGVSLILVSMFGLGCSFESRLEGTWKIVPDGVEARELTKRGFPPPTAQQLLSSTFVADDGVVYLGAEHPDAAMAKYRVSDVDGDCATVSVQTDSDQADVQACLDDDTLTVRHDGKGKPITVTLRRAD